MSGSDLKIAICFYGITRSLRHTIGSIKTNLIEPADKFGTVKTFAHFFDQDRVENPRSKESEQLDKNEFELLKADCVQLEQPDLCLDLLNFEALKTFGDARRDGFNSLRNLVHALHSLKQVTEMAAEWRPDIVIFARPDLQYHSSIEPCLKEAMQVTEPTIFIPDWQHWRGGYNDRFSVCVGLEAARVYGTRADQMLTYSETFREPLHSESLLRFVMKRSTSSIRFMSNRATRVRADGRLKKERFEVSFPDKLKTLLRRTRRKLRGLPPV